MPLTGNIGHDIKKEQEAGKPHKQAVAIALNVARKKGKKVTPRPKKEKSDAGEIEPTFRDAFGKRGGRR